MAYFMGNPTSIHRLLTGKRVSVIAPFFSSCFVFLRQCFGALLSRSVIGGNFLFERSEQLFQRTFDLAGQAEIGLVAVIWHFDAQWIFIEHGNLGSRGGRDRR